MKSKLLLSGLLAGAMMLPAVPASAHGYWHHGYGGGHDRLAFGLLGAVAGATLAVATLPFHAVEAVAAPPPAYYPPAYYAPPAYPAAYAPAPMYYPRRVVYAYPPAYAYPAYPGYY